MSNYRTAIPAALSLLTVACAPQSATLEAGEYTAFVDASNSLSLLKNELDPADFTDVVEVDCREFETLADRDRLELPNAIRICGENTWPPTYESWADGNAYYVVREELDPWRGQALITGEGDLQISFHHRLPGGADFRIVMAVDPEFGPVTCKNEADDYRHIRRDGDWVKEWSTELDAIAALPEEQRARYKYVDGLEGGRLFFMNADGYQFDPDAPVNTDTTWPLPREWMAGAAQGKFAEELMFHRPPRYGSPDVYNFVPTASQTVAPNAGDDMFYCDLERGEDPATSACVELLDTQLHDIVADTATELDTMSTPEGGSESLLSYAPIPHLNNWRPVDGLAPGFDGWGELDYSYVAFSKGSVLEVGGAADGAFGIVLESVDSGSKVFVQGKFKIDRIRRDRFTSKDLERENVEESGNQLCEAASWQDANLPNDPGL
jgi:hypothetical protein